MTVWIVYGGVRFGFSSIEALLYTGSTLDDVRVVPRGSLAGVPLVPPDGSFVQEFRTGLLYVIARGHRLQIGERELLDLGGSLEDVVGVPWGTLGEIPHAGRYAWWNRGRLGRVTIPAAALLQQPWPRRAAAWFATAIVGGVVSGLIVAWLQ